MFGPWIEIYTWLKSLKPTLKLSRPRFNYLTLHYMYMIALSILGSCVIFGIRNIAYIDALFFATGAATQSGLNTVNVNDLYLYQQIILGLIACVANPIFINSFLVFVRLYWFEKRFQSVVFEAQRIRRTRTIASRRSVTLAKDDKEDGDPALAETGFGGRNITVLSPGPQTMDAAIEEIKTEQQDTGSSSAQSSGNGKSSEESKEKGTEDIQNSFPEAEAPGPATQPFRRDITFADEVRKPRHMSEGSDDMPTQLQLSNERHIAFLENQRKQMNNEDEVLYIPGPRDFDRGEVPHQLSKEDTITANTPLTPVRRGIMRRAHANTTDSNDNNSDVSGPTSRFGTASTFERALSTARSAFPRFQTARTDATTDDNDPMNSSGLRRRGRRDSIASFVAGRNSEDGTLPYLSYQPTIGRNSTFVNLTQEQREELGGIEYRSLKTLAIILCSYYVGFHILGVIILTPWFIRSGTWGPIAEADGFNRAWWGIFTAASAFNDLGFTLTPDSMNSFQFAILPLLLMSFLIIIGNTGFPIMLRFIIWIMSICVPRGSAVWEELRFLLDHPRRCFTLLFPGRATWWLFWVLVLLNGVDIVFFVILDLKDPTVTVLPGGIRFLNGLFQAASTRTAGFADVNIAALHPAIQVSYLVMMYISVLPIAISVRRTNVYEEKSLGIYAGENDDEEDTKVGNSYVGAHLRRQLSFDLWYIFLGLFVIAIVEGDRIQSGDPNFTLYSCLFEIVSAYGTVGLSLGYPTTDASFSTEFSTLSKLVIIAMMIRGRHRGLPYALDKAIMLPSEGLHRKEEEDAMRRMNRRNSLAPSQWSVGSGGRGPKGERDYSDVNDVEKAPEEDAVLRNGAGPAAPGLRRLQTTEKGEADSTTKNKMQNGLARLISQVLSAGPTVKKKLAY